MNRSTLRLITKPLRAPGRVAIQRFEGIKLARRACAARQVNLIDATIVAEKLDDLQKLFGRRDKICAQ